jgi:hypothetical protein
MPSSAKELATVEKNITKNTNLFIIISLLKKMIKNMKV